MYIARHLSGIISGVLIASCIALVQAPERVLEIRNISTTCESRSESNEMSSCIDDMRKKNLDKLENLLVFYLPADVFMAVVLMNSSLWMGLFIELSLIKINILLFVDLGFQKMSFSV